MNTQLTLLRPAEAMRRLGLSRSTFYQAVKDGHLPKPVTIVPGGRASGFPEHEITAVVRDRMASRVDACKLEVRS
jgi:excisionase family DNA binding protein